MRTSFLGNVASANFLTHNMRYQPLQRKKEKESAPSHSDTDITSFQCWCIVDSISSLQVKSQNQQKYINIR